MRSSEALQKELVEMNIEVRRLDKDMLVMHQTKESVDTPMSMVTKCFELRAGRPGGARL